MRGKAVLIALWLVAFQTAYASTCNGTLASLMGTVCTLGSLTLDFRNSTFNGYPVGTNWDALISSDYLGVSTNWNDPRLITFSAQSLTNPYSPSFELSGPFQNSCNWYASLTGNGPGSCYGWTPAQKFDITFQVTSPQLFVSAPSETDIDDTAVDGVISGSIGITGVNNCPNSYMICSANYDVEAGSNLLTYPNASASASAFQYFLNNLVNGPTISSSLPYFYEWLEPPGAVVDQSYSTCGAIQVTGGYPPFTWTLFQGMAEATPATPPPGLAFSSSTGTFSGVPTQPGQYYFLLTVTDIYGGYQSVDLLLNVASSGSGSTGGSQCNSPLQITTTSLPSASLDSVYSQPLAAEGGTPPYSWSILPTTLPAGLQLVGNAVTGVPTSTGSYSLLAQVTDSNDISANGLITLSVGGSSGSSGSPLQITTAGLPHGQMGAPYDSSPSTATGGTPFPSSSYSFPYTWSATKLPPGLDVSYFTGEIYGLPANMGYFYPVLTVTDFTGQTASKSFALPISQASTKARYSPQEKAYYALLAGNDEKFALAYNLQAKTCSLYALVNPEAETICLGLDAAALGFELQGMLHQAMAGDPADNNFTVIAQPIPYSLGLLQPNPSWTAAQLLAFDNLKATILTEEQLIGLAQAEITCINRAEGAYEAGNTYWEQQQVAALTRYNDLEAFDLQLLLSEESQLKSAYTASGFPDFSVSVDDATQFELGVAANGLPAVFQQQLLALGLDADSLSFVTKAESSMDPTTVAGDFIQSIVPPSAIVATIQQLSSSFITQFSALSVKVQYSTHGSFQFIAPFSLGSANNGIDPVAEDVSFSLGSFAVTIPAGGFRQNKQGYYQYAGTIGSVQLQAIIKPTTTGYVLQIDGSGADTTEFGTPLAVSVQIGNDGGSAVATLDQ